MDIFLKGAAVVIAGISALYLLYVLIACTFYLLKFFFYKQVEVRVTSKSGVTMVYMITQYRAMKIKKKVEQAQENKNG